MLDFFLINYTLEPFLIGLFTAVGAGVPIALLLWWYSKKEKKRLKKTSPLIEVEIKALEDSQRIYNDIAQRYATKSKEVMDKGISTRDEIEKLLEGWNGAVGKAGETGIRIGELQHRIQYINNYGFWTIIENILERRYLGADSPIKQRNLG